MQELLTFTLKCLTTLSASPWFLLEAGTATFALVAAGVVLAAAKEPREAEHNQIYMLKSSQIRTRWIGEITTARMSVTQTTTAHVNLFDRVEIL